MLNNFFTINRKDRALPFLFQTIIGAINFILFIALIVALIVFRNNLDNYYAFIVYFLYSFYVAISFSFAIIFYYYLYNSLNKSERNYFKALFIHSLFGINFFTSINFYFKSGLSKSQKIAALQAIHEKRIIEIIDDAIAKKKLKPADIAKIKTLLKIAENKHEEWANVSSYILQILKEKNISVTIKIKDSEIIERGSYL